MAVRVSQIVTVLTIIGQIKSQSLSDYIFRPVNTFNTFINGITETNNQAYRPQQGNNFDDRFDASELSGHSGSSCDSYWRLQRDFSGSSFGMLTIPNPDRSRNVIKITLSLPAKLASKNVGSIDLSKDEQTTAREIANGLPVSYRINFPLQNPVPQLTAVVLNDQLLCSGPAATGGYITTINLQHSFVTGIDFSAGSNVQPRPTQPPVQPQPQPQWVQQQTQPPPTRPTQPQRTQPPRTQPTRPPTAPPDTVTQNNAFYDDSQCGISSFKPPSSTPLIVHGQVASRGQFPWLAAYYHNGQIDSGFICGGSLLSSKLIVTAAHCVQTKGDAIQKKPEEATFYLGKYNLLSLAEENYVPSGVSQFIMHPNWNWNDKKYDGDIAIAVLVRTISFSKFVRPICLWTGSTSFLDLVGKKGKIAGWGKTETHSLSSETPRWGEITVVDTVTCLRSNKGFIEITSDKTFCAGDRVEGKGPCNGDSGGAFFVENGNKNYLRGIVSAALWDQQLSTCDTKNYAVFTDVQMFLPWLQGNIQQYG